MLSAVGTVARVIRAECGGCRVRARMQICLRHTQAQRRALVVSAKDGWSTRREDNEVAICIASLWSILAESGNGHVNQARIGGGEIMVAKADMRQRAWIFRFDQK